MIAQHRDLPPVIVEHRSTTETTVASLRDELLERLGDKAGEVIGEHTTFILTGSAGRGEMTDGSDIDGYVVRVDAPVDRYHDALLLCATVNGLKSLGLPPLDRGGEFQAMKTGSSLVDCLGSTEDDPTNALTTRMLFLLEGRPLVGDRAYEKLLLLVQQAYRSTAHDHADDFLPFFLVNDIIRYWRTVLLNHEDRLRQKQQELGSQGMQDHELRAALLAHRRYRSQKLRFPRCATCFSALAYILAIAPSDSDSVSEDAEREMFHLTPLARLESIAKVRPETASRIDTMLNLYAGFLHRSSGPKDAVVERLRDDDDFAEKASREGQQFTEEMYVLIQQLGGSSRLHRHMLI